MLIHFLYVFLNIIYLINGEILIRESGVTYRNSEDMAIFFYLTLENTCEKDWDISVNMIKCIENLPHDEKELNSIYLIGGEMGILNARCSRNVTLLYPNLYLKNRIGKCLISVIYKNDEFKSEIVKEICFNTTDLNTNEISWYDKKKCATEDLDSSDDCLPVDCTIKYSSALSYFDQTQQRCVKVPTCCTNFQTPNRMIFPKAYIPITNKCQSLRQIIKPRDLRLLENCRFRTSSVAEFINYRCHHGQMNNNTGLCECYDGWTSRSCSEDIYEPNLSIFHMCNIKISSWTSMSKYKIGLTALAFSIFALAITAKIFLAICILNLCYKWIKSNDQEKCQTSCNYKSSSSYSNFSAEYIPINRCVKCCKPKRQQFDESADNKPIFIKRPQSTIKNPSDDQCEDELSITQDDLDMLSASNESGRSINGGEDGNYENVNDEEIELQYSDNE